jgi:hypothetical protein
MARIIILILILTFVSCSQERVTEFEASGFNPNGPAIEGSDSTDGNWDVFEGSGYNPNGPVKSD